MATDAAPHEEFRIAAGRYLDYQVPVYNDAGVVYRWLVDGVELKTRDEPFIGHEFASRGPHTVRIEIEFEGRTAAAELDVVALPNFGDS